MLIEKYNPVLNTETKILKVRLHLGPMMGEVSLECISRNVA